MAQIGSISIKKESGVIRIPIYQLEDFSSDVVDSMRVETSTGTGAIPLVEPSSSEYPFLRVMTSNGVYAVHDAATLGAIIDDFENGDLNEYNWDGGGNSSYFSINSNGNYVYEGQYSLEMQPAGTSSNGIVSENGLNYYPQDGDKIEWHIWFQSLNSGTYAARPEIRLGQGSDGEAIRLRYSNRSNELRLLSAGSDTAFDPENHMYEWLRTELTIDLPDVTVKVFDSSGNQITSLSATHQDWDISNQSIGYYITSSTAGDSTIYWDSIQKI